VPNDLGPSSWIAGQYQRFLQGLDQVGTINAPRLSRSQVQPKVRVDPGKQPQISIPHWDDVIRLGPRPVVSPEELELHKHFERAGLPSPLSPELQQAVADRRAMAKRIQNSAIPEYMRGVSAMMTVVDNVQDAALTLAVAGRIAVTALGRFGPWFAPAVAGMARVATMLNWLGLAIVIFGVAYAFACQGARDALSQARQNALAGYLFKGLRAVVPRARGIPTPFPAAGSKGRHGVAMFGVPSGREVSNHRASRWAKARPSFGELLQIGQVAYDHLGYGLALGAIIGMSSETAYAQARRAQGETVTIRSPDVSHVLELLLRSTLAGYNSGALWHRQQCARAIGSAPFILRDPWSWGDELYALTWVVYYACLEPIMGDLEGVPWRDPVIARLGSAAWTPFADPDPVTVSLLEELELPPAEPVWPIAGNPRELTAERLVVELGKEIGDALRRWLEEAPNEPLRRFVAEMSMNVCERVWYFLEGANDWPAWRLSPATAVWESLFLAARWPVLSDPPELIQAAWSASEQYVRDRGRQAIPVEVLDRIWTDAGSPLLRLGSSSATLPLETFLPVDESSRSSGAVAFGQDLAEARRRLEELLRQEPPAGP